MTENNSNTTTTTTSTITASSPNGIIGGSASSPVTPLSTSASSPLENRPHPEGHLQPPEDQSNDMMDDMRLFMRTINAFRNYDVQARTSQIIREKNFEKLPPEHKALLQQANIALNTISQSTHDGISWNQSFLSAICDGGMDLFESYWPGRNLETIPDDEPTQMDSDKVFSTIRQFVRDWSTLGAQERQDAYGPILHALNNLFPDRSQRSKMKVLVPGAGLCRLSVEIALAGFCCQANEFSYHMLIAGHYVQNHVARQNQHRIFPYVDNTSNLISRDDQFTPCDIPDMYVMDAVDQLAAQGLTFGELSMVAGDFTEVYRKPQHHGQWNVVASCFFLDTAHNIIEYLEVIYAALAPGGFLVNVGPLLYHFADVPQTNTPGSVSVHGIHSIELSLSELIAVARGIGFDVVAMPQIIRTSYTGNPRSMKQLVYQAACFVLQKKAVPPPPPPPFASAESN